MTIRRHLGRLLLGLAAIALAIPASASATTINAAGLTVYAYPTSGLDAARNSHNLFYSSSYSGFFVRFADGPLADRTYGHSWGQTNAWTAVSQSEPTRDGTTQTAETVYAARNGTADVVRVQQTVRVVDSARTFRVTYRVQNMTDQPLRYRALTGGELNPGGSSSGIGRTLDGPPRFLGAESASGIRAGVQEVRSSRLASDDADVAVPAWTIRRAAGYSIVGSEISSAAGPPNTVVEPNGNKAVAVAWEDHLPSAAALAPGASARYEVVWRVTDQPGLSLASNDSSRYVGARSVLSGRLADSAGQPIGGESIRWSITGANPTDTPGEVTTAADGEYSLSYVGAKEGTDSITVWADTDGDGALGASELRRDVTVWWYEPPPQLMILQTSSYVVRVGNAIGYEFTLRNAIGEPVTGGALRWKVTGVNPTAGEQAVATDTTGSAAIKLTATRAGIDVLEVYSDRDGDSEQDADEPHAERTITWAPPPPPITIETYSYTNPRITQTSYSYVRVYDDLGVLAKNTGLIWSVTGANPRASSTAQTNSYGETTIAYQGANVGVDTLSVGHDRNGDGELGAGEPVKTHTVIFRQAAPPPTTSQTLDADGLNVTLTSVGGVQARFDGEGRDVFDYSGYTGFHLRVLDGPLAGKSYSTTGYDGGAIEPFYGDPQTAPTRTGSDVVQRSSWRVRVDDKDVLRVHQIARLSDGATSFRLTWRVENLTDSAMRLRAGHLGDVSIDGRSSGAPVVLTAPRRFVGIASDGGLAAGIEAVTASRLPEESASVPVADWSATELDDPWTLSGHMGDSVGLRGSATTPSDAAAVQWNDHAAEGQGLGAGDHARYEVVWRLRKPMPLRLNPPSDVAETRHAHEITATLLDDAEQPTNGTTLRWSITGANPRTGSASTAGLGQVVIAWTGTNLGEDTVTVYADHDDDGVRDPDEPQRTAKVTWRVESAVDPPKFAPLIAPNGNLVNVNLQTQGPDRFLEITPSQAALFPRCSDGSGRRR